VLFTAFCSDAVGSEEHLTQGVPL